MIHVFFVPGMFGSTVEYVLRSHSLELDPVDAKILSDGSMHSFRKQAHLRSHWDIHRDLLPYNSIDVATPQYPTVDMHLPEILVHYNKYITDTDRFVLIYAPDQAAAELNMLFMYHKIAAGSLALGLDMFLISSKSQNVQAWNTSYTHWSDMQPWELREYMSFFYPGWIQEWIESQYQVPDYFITVTNTDLLTDTLACLNRVFEHCALTPRTSLAQFVDQWVDAQQYVREEWQLLDKITQTAVSGDYLEWQPMNIVAEAIVQQRLRCLDLEILCDGLNQFPTNSLQLRSVLRKAD